MQQSRSRYFEIFAYRKLLIEYFMAGALWVSAPKGSMSAEFYRPEYDPEVPRINDVRQFAISENEIAFDAADFVRLGYDIIAQKSHVTNELGIEWVRRHLGEEFRVHAVEFGDEHPMHIDTTIVPLAPGKVLVNPNWVKEVPTVLKDWEVLVAPPPSTPGDNALYFSSDWLTMNMLSINERQVLVEAGETPMIEALYRWGFDPIPVPFRNFYPFGGSFHCATKDVRRRGDLRSYS